MVLQALEFSDCLWDSPHFRDKLNAHEKELENTSTVVKRLIKEGRELIKSVESYIKCQQAFAQTLIDYKFETIGSQQTDDEIIISKSLGNFGNLIMGIETERSEMAKRTQMDFVDKLEEFRKTHIASAKEARKKFEKATKQYCAYLEKNLGMKTVKTAEAQFQESDEGIEGERQQFHREAMAYVMKLQEVQERKKFEFVETLLGFMLGWRTFHHEAYETEREMEPYIQELSGRIQKTRDNFESTRDEATNLMNKMLQKPDEERLHTISKMFTRQGYLYCMEKKTIGPVSWMKYFCSYSKDTKIFTMIPFNQLSSNAGKLNLTPDTMVLLSCIRRANDSIDRRFCFDITVSLQEKQVAMTLQALSDKDRLEWLEAMDGKEPVYSQPTINKESQEYSIDEMGIMFVNKCIEAVETRGLTDQGLYRVVGVSSKVSRLMQNGLDSKRVDKLNLVDSSEYEVKTITSALKNYLRNLSEPLLTYRLHQKLITAAKLENMEARIEEIAALVKKLPAENFDVLKILVKHLKQVASKHEQNLMNVSNLSVCFGPTLLRPEEETVAAIMDIKFCNVVVEILIENYDMIFENNSSADESATKKDAVTNASKLYTEESTYGKNRPSIRTNSLYSPFTTRSVHNQRPSSEISTNNNNTVYRLTAAPAQTSNYHYASNAASGSSESSSGRADNFSSQQKGPPRNFAQNPVAKPLYANLNNGRSPRESADSKSPDYRNSMMSQSYTGLPSSSPNNQQQPSIPGPGAPLITRRVRALYQCDAENDTELSFQPNDIIYNVRESREPGWLEGTINGKTGLIPANYIEYIN